MSELNLKHPAAILTIANGTASIAVGGLFLTALGTEVAIEIELTSLLLNVLFIHYLGFVMSANAVAFRYIKKRDNKLTMTCSVCGFICLTNTLTFSFLLDFLF